MNLLNRTVAAIAAGENLTDDRRKLLLIGSLEAVAVLKATPGARSLWLDPPGCFAGHATIVGSFAGVPVAQRHLEGMPARGFVLMLGDQLISIVEF